MAKLTIYKSNDLIEAGYRLSLAEQRFIVLSLGQIDSRDIKQKKVTLYAKDYAREWGVSEVNAMREMKQATNRLFDRYITLKNADETTKFRWIQSVAKYNKGEARITFTFSDDILPFLFELDFKLGVTKYELLNVSGFSSVYSLRLYELAIKLLGMKNPVVGIDELRRILQLEKKYAQFKEFNKFVIKPALRDINEKSDIILDIEHLKICRSVAGFYFEVKKKDTRKNHELSSNNKRQIHGVFIETNRPRVAKNSQAETDWLNENYNRAIKQMRDMGILKAKFLEDQLKDIPTEWLKVLKKYATTLNRYLSREIADELENRKNNN